MSAIAWFSTEENQDGDVAVVSSRNFLMRFVFLF